MTAAIIALVGLFGCWIAYRAGYERGREHELNKAAARHERMKRFSEHQTYDK
jgi:hypothetical protein